MVASNKWPSSNLRSSKYCSSKWTNSTPVTVSYTFWNEISVCLLRRLSEILEASEASNSISLL